MGNFFSYLLSAKNILLSENNIHWTEKTFPNDKFSSQGEGIICSLPPKDMTKSFEFSLKFQFHTCLEAIEI